MAVPSNTVLASTRANAREDLQDVIYDISPTDTPVLSMTPRTSAKARYHEWNVDTLANAAANAAIEGNDATAGSSASVTRPGQRMQILQKTVQVSGTTEAIDKAGYRSEMAYQMQKRSKEIKRDLEYAITRNTGTTSGSTTTAATMAGIESYLTTNIIYAAAQGQATTPGYSSGSVAAPVDPTVTGAFTESLIKSLSKSCWDNGGEPDFLIVDSFNKQAVSGFAGIATLYRDTDVKSTARASILGGADIYISDFSGQSGLKVVADRFTRGQTALMLDFDYLQLAYLRPFGQKQLAKTGDSEKRQILAECGIVVNNEAAHGKIVGLTTS